ncbi:MAG: hypothetical protein NZ700_05350 [Gemmataceae bacterium]|nr:hypothetical protein [Gemmataceae bacterium]MDW8265101.1 hypothetical protein [Gemmataceae bacterium]
MWFRVFGRTDATIPPAAVLERIHTLWGISAPGRCRADDLGWFELAVPLGDRTLVVNRYLASEDGIREELSNWAAWLEWVERPELMPRIIQAQQLFTLEGSDASAAELCRFLAGQTDGLYHIDGQGLFAADGTLLVADA